MCDDSEQFRRKAVDTLASLFPVGSCFTPVVDIWVKKLHDDVSIFVLKRGTIGTVIRTDARPTSTRGMLCTIVFVADGELLTADFRIADGTRVDIAIQIFVKPYV